ncbi:MAG TPA: Crp/Fnr family transcriptional regulator [Candidatus Saccharimonadales bacterium]|nr:Crp/Fnr family transcriptional regulator [Candidatus Saccharimonadales bacterium]
MRIKKKYVTGVTDTIMEQIVADFFADKPTKHLAKGEVLIFADGTVPDVFYLKSGMVGQYAINEAGGKVMLTVFKAGSFFPMSAALNAVPNQYFFEALEACDVHSATPEQATTFLQEHPDVALDLLKRVYRGTDGLLAKLAELMGGNAYHRLKNELTILAKRFGHEQPDGRIRIRITEQELAELTGLARETVSKTLSKLSKDGFVETGHGALNVIL